MSEIEHSLANAKEIGREILRKGIILGIDWNDQTQVIQLAHKTLAFRSVAHKWNRGNGEARSEHQWKGEERIMAELSALTSMMLHTIVGADDFNLLDQGGEAWQIFLKALIEIQGNSKASNKPKS